MAKIGNKVKDAKLMPVKDFLALDFNSLKADGRDVSKLINSIRADGWCFPVFIWAGHNYVIDGKGRKLAVEKMIADGDEFENIPYVEIEAETLEEAKKHTLHASSQFGLITMESFKVFTDDFKTVDDNYNFIGLDPQSIEDDPDSKVMTQSEELVSLRFTFTKDQLEVIKSVFRDIRETDDYRIERVSGKNKSRNGNSLYILAKLYSGDRTEREATGFKGLDD